MTKINIKILLIEDNPADALLLKESLNNDPLTDFQVTVAEHLKQGLEKLETEKFDVLLLDLGLPDSQGLRTFEIAHAKFPELPVLVLSGMTDELTALQAVQSGAQDYLVKGEACWNQGPRAIRYAVERSQAQSAMRASEARFSTFFNSSPIPTAITRLSDNHVIEVNKAWIKITGYSLAEVVGRSLSEFNLWVDPEKREQIIGMLRKAGVVHGVEFQMRQKSGEIASLLFSAELIQVAEEPCMLSMALDITERKQSEVKIYFQSALLDAVGQAVIATDMAGAVIYFNRAAEELYGWSTAEALGRNIMQINVPDISQAEAVEIMEYLNKGKTWSGEFMVQRRDGTVFPATVSDSPVADETGKLIGIIGISADITQRKQAEAALRESEEKMRSIFRVAPTGIGVVRDRILLDVNPRICEMTGYAREELIGQNARILYPTQDEFESVGREKYQQIAQQGSGQVETHWQRKGGSMIDILLASTPIDLADLSRGVTFTALDITERKYAEEALRQSEDRYRSIFDGVQDAIFLETKDGRVLGVNQRACEMYGYSRDEFLGKAITDLVPEGSSLFPPSGIQSNISPSPLETINRRANGNLFPIEISGRLQTINGEEIFLVIVRDITERKQAEKQVEIQLRRMQSLREIDRAISSSLDMHLSLDILLDQVLSQLEVDAASVLLLDTSSQCLEYMAGKGFRSPAIQKSQSLLGIGLSGKVGMERKAIHISDLSAVGDQFMRRELLKDENFLEYFGVPLIAKGVLKGVLEIFHCAPIRPDPEWANYLETLGGQAAIAIDNAQLFMGIQQSNLELITAYDATIVGWSRAMDLRDKETEGHTLRVTELTVKLAKRMGVNQAEIVQIRRGALLHDIGKLGVPDQILHKPDKLDRLEWAIMRQHPTYAFNMLLPINYLRSALDIPYCHHEKWDGTGYPRGLKEEQIPLAARIFAVVDVWDALRSDRPYRASWTFEQTRELILEEAGKHFDPQVVSNFMQIIEEE